MNIEYLINRFNLRQDGHQGLRDYSGNPNMYTMDLNAEDHVVIDCSDYSSIHVFVYIIDKHEIHFKLDDSVAENFDHLDSKLHSIYELWGDK